MSIAEEKVYFTGIVNSHDKQFMVFVRETNGKSIQIPVNDETARHVMLYMEKLMPRTPKVVERGNDEDST